MSDFVFFYGTLLPQHAPPAMRGVIARLRPYGEGSVGGVLFDFGEYPGAVLNDSSDKRVFGAVYRLPEESNVLDELDRYEGYDPASPRNSLFVRKRCPVSLSNGSVVECWIYEYNGSTVAIPIVASGRYIKGNVATR